MNVSELMTHPVRTCSPEDSCAAAAQHMWDGDCGCVVVTDAQGRLAGVLTDRDLCMATFTTGRSLDAIPVARLLGRPVRTCRPDDSLPTALQTMATHQLHRLPVIDQTGKLVGMISVSDIAQRATPTGATPRSTDLPTQVLQTLAQIKAPRTPVTKSVPSTTDSTVKTEKTVAIPPVPATPPAVGATTQAVGTTTPAATTKPPVTSAPSATTSPTATTKPTPTKPTPEPKAKTPATKPAPKTGGAKTTGAAAAKPRTKR